MLALDLMEPGMAEVVEVSMKDSSAEGQKGCVVLELKARQQCKGHSRGM